MARPREGLQPVEHVRRGVPARERHPRLVDLADRGRVRTGPGHTDIELQSLGEILAETGRLNQEAARLDALPYDEVVPNRWIGNRVEGLSCNQMVAVLLSIHGRTERIAFSDQWLRQARVAEVCEAVMEAHRSAYAQFVPPVFEPGDRQRLADRFGTLQEQSMALLGALAPRGGSR